MKTRVLTVLISLFVLMIASAMCETVQAEPWLNGTGGIYYNAGKVGIGTTGPGALLDVRGQIIGGFGSQTTAGALDWNHLSNSRPGSGYTLLYGNATNGPNNTGHYYHPFNFEYGGGKSGSGNITQLAIPYGDANSINSGLYIRGRYKPVIGTAMILCFSPDR